MVKIKIGDALMRSRISQFTSLDLLHDTGVGVMELKTSQSKIPFRIYYPATESSTTAATTTVAAYNTSNRSNSVAWFVYGFAYFIEGYIHFLLPNWRKSKLQMFLVSCLAWVLSWIIPKGNANLPKCLFGAPPASDIGPFPLIVYSHGLTGSGEEHGLMFTYWAQRGYVVASIHHCEGSSCMVPRELDDHLMYVHPDLTNYDKQFRPVQVRKREAELYELKQFICKNAAFPTTIRGIIDETNVVAAGFSYGAATAALSSVTHPGEYTCCILIDGWFRIDLQNHALDFPEEVHAKGLNLPALFIGSEQFKKWTTCSEATNRLAAANAHPSGSGIHVLEGSRHQNFTDVGFWVSTRLLKWATMIGSCDYDETYKRMLDLTTGFLNEHTKINRSKQRK